MGTYVAVIHKERRSEYGVSFPDFPGCVSAGVSLEDAREQAHEALELHVRGMVEDGDGLPLPCSLDEAEDHSLASDALALILIEVEDPVRTERINCTFRSDVLHRIDAFVARHGLPSRSAFLADAALEVLERDQKPSD